MIRLRLGREEGLLRPLRSDLEKVPQLSVKHRELTRQMDELLPPAIDPQIDL